MSWEKDFIKSFESKISPEPNTGCWLWLGNVLSKRNGYAVFTHRPTNIIMQRAHRISWKIYKNHNITQNDHVLHKCDNPICVNPDHLFIGDQIKNMEDMAMKNRHAFGTKHPRYKHGKYIGHKQKLKYHT